MALETESMEIDENSLETITYKTHEGLEAGASIEGWVIIVTNIHEEATEDDVIDVFEEYGKVRSIHLNLDRRTGYVKGYALIEYKDKQEASKAVIESNGIDLLGQILTVDYAFVDINDVNDDIDINDNLNNNGLLDTQKSVDNTVISGEITMAE